MRTKMRNQQGELKKYEKESTLFFLVFLEWTLFGLWGKEDTWIMMMKKQQYKYRRNIDRKGETYRRKRDREGKRETKRGDLKNMKKNLLCFFLFFWNGHCSGYGAKRIHGS